MADTTTTMSCPSARALATRLATFLMRSGEPTDVPPYLCTINAMFRAFCLRLVGQRGAAKSESSRLSEQVFTLRQKAGKSLCILLSFT